MPKSYKILMIGGGMAGPKVLGIAACALLAAPPVAAYEWCDVPPASQSATDLPACVAPTVPVADMRLSTAEDWVIGGAHVL